MPQSNILDNTRSNQSTSANEINDLITIPPSWLLNSGITMVALVSVTILCMSHFIKYPDKIAASAIMTSLNPPIEVISRSGGYIDIIHSKENTDVDKGGILLHINNTTNQNDLDVLSAWILKYEKIKDPRGYLSLSFPENLELGNIQSASGNLELKYKELCQVLKNRIVFEQIASIRGEIETIDKLNNSLTRENKIFVKELELVSNNYKRQEKLFREGAISEVELEGAKSSLLQKERQSEEITNRILQNKIQIKQKELESINLKDQRFKAIEDYQFVIDQVIMQINNTIENWSRSYNVEAPISGKVDYISGLSAKKSIKAGQIIGYILPDGITDRYISATFPVSNVGKIKIGQRVLIKLDAYPYKEFGMIESEVISISGIPEMNNESIPGYEVTIPLSDTIITDTGIIIPYKPNMTATVEVITEDRTIFDRIFDQFLGLMKNV